MNQGDGACVWLARDLTCRLPWVEEVNREPLRKSYRFWSRHWRVATKTHRERKPDCSSEGLASCGEEKTNKTLARPPRTVVDRSHIKKIIKQAPESTYVRTYDTQHQSAANNITRSRIALNEVFAQQRGRERWTVNNSSRWIPLPRFLKEVPLVARRQVKTVVCMIVGRPVRPGERDPFPLTPTTQPPIVALAPYRYRQKRTNHECPKEGKSPRGMRPWGTFEGKRWPVSFGDVG